ncbi:signal transduction histidine kinase [Crossiella equi]|uniref:histidine kinase n=1 Tax=Crossiella equi TaxID=130796 RepID=A0ABS5AT23_9PSEU|nr:histidine kinase [Crossiella equi]MBP2479349.1 signal transduction histidine kinase [Crossiella equi]
MHSDWATRFQRRGTWLSVAVLLLLLPALVAPFGAILVAVSASLALAAAVWPWPWGKMSLAAAIGTMSGLSLLLDAVYPGHPGMTLVWMPVEFTALLVLFSRGVRHLPGKQVLPLSALAGAAILLLPLRFTLHSDPIRLDTSVLAAATALFPLAIAAGVGVYLRGLDNRRVVAVDRARQEQRLEVARDLHDFVAHEVTGIVVEAQAAQYAGFSHEEALAAFARVEAAGLRALASMDRTVAALRAASEDAAPPPPRLYGIGDLPELLGRFGEGGTRVDLRLDEHTTGQLDREADACAYAVVLESLTNIRRHAPATALVTVHVELVPGPAVAVTVTDAGDPAATGQTREGGGSGLAGLAERCEALGGRLDAGRSGPGWAVRVTLPAQDLSRTVRISR